MSELHLFSVVCMCVFISYFRLCHFSALIKISEKGWPLHQPLLVKIIISSERAREDFFCSFNNNNKKKEWRQTGEERLVAPGYGYKITTRHVCVKIVRALCAPWTGHPQYPRLSKKTYYFEGKQFKETTANTTGVDCHSRLLSSINIHNLNMGTICIGDQS